LSADIDGNGLGSGDCVATCVALDDATLTPLPQTNFFPCFTQLKLDPAEINVWFNLRQGVPGLTAAEAGLDDRDPNNVTAMARTRDLRMVRF
jgi:hypothetical protein